MTTDLSDGIKASRMRVPRTRGALSGIALIVLGAWAALVPFIGPYFDFAFSPAPNDAWHWTASRGWLSLLPGVAALVAGLLLLVGTHRLSLTFASWLGVVSGAWLVVGPVLAPRISLNPGQPAGTSGWLQTMELLFVYFAIGAGILFFGATALGRLSVQSVRDVKVAQRRVNAAAAREEEERRRAEQRLAEERAGREQAGMERGQAQQHDEAWLRQREDAAAAGRSDGSTAPGEVPSGPRHERPADQPPNFLPPQQQTLQQPIQQPATAEQPVQEQPTQQQPIQRR